MGSPPPHLLTPAIVQFPCPAHVSVLFSLLTMYPSTPTLFFKISFHLCLIWAALAGPLTCLTLMGDQPCGDPLSVPMGNFSPQLRRASSNTSAVPMCGPWAEVEQMSQRIDKESSRRRVRYKTFSKHGSQRAAE